jgi:hypothetical protein
MTPHPVTWATPSADAAGAMPLGNGDIGVMAWAEANGDVLLYIGTCGSWDENGRLLKVGRLRLHFSHNPFAAGKPFQQRLDAGRGEIEIVAGEPGDELRIRLWADANRPVVRIESESDRESEIEARLEVWRTVERELPENEDSCPIGKLSQDERTRVAPDTIMEAGDALAWCHRNERSVWAATLRHQDLGELIPELRDPLLGLTSGALVRGEHLGGVDRTTLRSQAPGKRFTVSVHLLVAPAASAAEWLGLILAQAAATDRLALDTAREEHRNWWEAFWQRSHIVASGSPEAETVSQGYALQRFLQAGASRGRFPMKFNGSLFTVDGTRETARAGNGIPATYDADYRLWGGGYWFQNCRLLYWSMLMAGDVDLMKPFFRMYQDALPLAEARTRLYFGHGGAFFPETMAFWGTYLNENYGYDRSGKTVAAADVIAAVRGETARAPWRPGEVANSYIRHYWQGGIELLAMLLDYQAVTADGGFCGETLLPLARPILKFYREHYPQRDGDGSIRFAPAQAIETWQVAANPLPEIAGLRWVTAGLLRLPDLPDADRAAWTELRELLPPLPARVEYWNKKAYLIPALEYDVLANFENPELYAVFPYRHFGVGKPDLEMGRETYARRLYKTTGCWRQDAIQAALLGLTEEAQRDVTRNFGETHPSFRFPAIWGPNSDWIPDHDHGGVAMIALQRMALQWDDTRILLLPAWPKDWDVSFKLWAPGNTTVECVYRGGQVERLAVTPPSRRRDVVMPNATELHA